MEVGQLCVTNRSITWSALTLCAHFTSTMPAIVCHQTSKLPEHHHRMFAGICDLYFFALYSSSNRPLRGRSPRATGWASPTYNKNSYFSRFLVAKPPPALAGYVVQYPCPRWTTHLGLGYWTTYLCCLVCVCLTLGIPTIFFIEKWLKYFVRNWRMVFWCVFLILSSFLVLFVGLYFFMLIFLVIFFCVAVYYSNECSISFVWRWFLCLLSWVSIFFCNLFACTFFECVFLCCYFLLVKCLYVVLFACYFVLFLLVVILFVLYCLSCILIVVYFACRYFVCRLLVLYLFIILFFIFVHYFVPYFWSLFCSLFLFIILYYTSVLYFLFVTLYLQHMGGRWEGRCWTLIFAEKQCASNN